MQTLHKSRSDSSATNNLTMTLEFVQGEPEHKLYYENYYKGILTLFELRVQYERHNNMVFTAIIISLMAYCLVLLVFVARHIQTLLYKLGSHDAGQKKLIK